MLILTIFIIISIHDINKKGRSMKHFILIASTITATNSMTAMETPLYYQNMLTRISRAAQGQPSITIINDSKSSLLIEVGDLEIDNIKSRINLHQDTQLKFSPYGHPFCLKKQLIKNSTILNLTLFGQEQHLPIGDYSKMQFGDTIRVTYDENNKKIIIARDNKTTMKTLQNSYNHINLSVFRTRKLSNPTKISQSSSTPKRSNTIS
jgi:hypothetical protein